jgi:hypothetical protein
MKKKNFALLCLMALLLFTANACNDEKGDTQKPSINLIEPENDDVLKIGDDVHFEAELADNQMLKSYKVEIHPNFDGHSHQAKAENATVDFNFNKEWNLDGRKNASIHHHEIIIPENATPGHYHLLVYCIDEAGNEAHVAVNIELSHDAEEHHHDDDEDEHNE